MKKKARKVDPVAEALKEVARLAKDPKASPADLERARATYFLRLKAKHGPPQPPFHRVSDDLEWAKERTRNFIDLHVTADGRVVLYGNCFNMTKARELLEVTWHVADKKARGQA